MREGWRLPRVAFTAAPIARFFLNRKPKGVSCIVDGALFRSRLRPSIVQVFVDDNQQRMHSGCPQEGLLRDFLSHRIFKQIRYLNMAVSKFFKERFTYRAVRSEEHTS